MNPIRFLRRLRNKIFVTAYIAGRPDVRRAQDTIAELSTQPFYLSDYRVQEPHYWLPIPDWLCQDFSSAPPARCLDIGCAYGTLAVYCKQQFGGQVYATDLYSTFFSPNLGHKLGIHFAIHNVELDPLPWPGPFDVILMTEVLEHLNFHPLSTLQKICRALSPQGRFYLTTPDVADWGRRENLYASLDQIPAMDPNRPILDRHIYIYSREELVNLVQSAGFQVLRIGSAPGIQYRHHALTLAVNHP